MAKYKTKHCEIDAIQWNGINLEEIKAFVGESLIYDICDTAWQVGKGRPHVHMKIRTLEGDMEASEGDYIIKGLVGEFYPCKPDVFEKKYVLNNTNSNADRIRNMTDEELAELFYTESYLAIKANTLATKEETLEWLQAEVKEGNTNEST